MMCDRAIGLLEHRYRVLAARAKQRQPTPVERRELEQTATALEELQAMRAGTTT